jgi:hypothetical protein
MVQSIFVESTKVSWTDFIIFCKNWIVFNEISIANSMSRPRDPRCSGLTHLTLLLHERVRTGEGGGRGHRSWRRQGGADDGLVLTVVVAPVE